MKVEPIPEKLWSALGAVSGAAKVICDNKRIKYEWDRNNLSSSVDLVIEYILCHAADGSVSQRGEVPQCWNSDTVFTPHREVKTAESFPHQLEFAWEEDLYAPPNMVKCSVCNGTGIQEETMKGYRRYKCWSCEGEKEVVSSFDTEGSVGVGVDTNDG